MKMKNGLNLRKGQKKSKWMYAFTKAGIRHRGVVCDGDIAASVHLSPSHLAESFERIGSRADLPSDFTEKVVKIG